jgi:hypothetical protein
LTEARNQLLAIHWLVQHVDSSFTRLRDAPRLSFTGYKQGRCNAFGAPDRFQRIEAADPTARVSALASTFESKRP